EHRVLARAARHRDRSRADRSHHDGRESIRPPAHGGRAARTCPPRLNVMAVQHRIEPARLLPGVGLADIESRAPAAETGPAEHAIRGKALILWDRSGRRPGKKLDAIDTDQITPAKDCVSESLETLDERWKAGSFRYLMPEFRSRVHAGETFLVAGDRFAIGSSREIFTIGRREFAASVRRAPDVAWPDDETAAGMTTTERIVWAHRVDKDADARPGATLRVYADLLPASDGTAPFAIHTFN